MKKRLIVLLSALGLASPGLALAEWTPLITASMFDGVKADVIVAVGGILTLSLIIFGLAMLLRATGR